ncbi:UDP-N-acetylglucosamine 4,6-dehydratase (inverting) [Candidatus Pacearchaeota archaeon]|nr:UDP-N-acetylglucosamine 4,6-dehydratase (inverting) [Candidatus Pacearchaeota archaeon]|tara:strand:+ start:2699 stop:3814 length:1116 start_codon:yes stop_codon:yes gene_type:complete
MENNVWGFKENNSDYKGDVINQERIERSVSPNFQKKIFEGKTILITGGTGSFGNAFIKHVLEHDCPKQIIVYSRDEMKQWFMNKEYGNKILKFVLGDVRDRKRLSLACKGVDYIVHTAAMKIVHTGEENPPETIKTNILGAMNIIEVALENNIEKVIAFSTDKACNPVNLYGATKLCSDKLFVAANSHSPTKRTSFAVARYGNVIGSRGSIIPFFLEKKREGVLPITDERMTRFWITLEDGVKFVVNSLRRMRGGEIFVPKIPSMRIVDLAKAIAPECEIKYIGIKPGEKLHESMIAADDARNVIEFEDYYIIQPQFDWWEKDYHVGGKSVSDTFQYVSNTNPKFLTIDDMVKLVGKHVRAYNEYVHGWKK